MRHELRLLYRDFVAQRRVAIAMAVGVVGLYAIAWLFAVDQRAGAHVSTKLSLLMATIALATGLLLMVGRAVLLSIQVLDERRDADLLMSSPLRIETIFAARASAIALASVAEVALYVLPFAHVFALFGDLRWLMAHLALPMLGCLATSTSLWSAFWLFRLVGVRRARAIAHFAVRFAPFVALQASMVAISYHVHLQGNGRKLSIAVPGVDSALWIPARAVMGSPVWTPIAVLLCAGMLVTSIAVLAPRFGEAFARTSLVTTRRGRDGAPPRLRTHRLLALVRKDLRVALRNPQLGVQLLANLLLVTAGTIMSAKLAWRGVPASWLWMVPAAGLVASAVAPWIASNEEAPDLLRSAPIGALHLMSSQLLASLTPSLLGALLCGALLAIEHPSVAGWLTLCSLGHALSQALPYLRAQRRQAHFRFDLRLLFSLPIAFLQIVNLTLWTGAAVIGFLVWA